MGSYEKIIERLNRFVSKYYRKQLVKGLLLFLTLGGLLFFALLGLEYFLWLGSTGRMILFLAMCVGGGFLFYKYIALPLFYLFRIKQGLSIKQASLLIGKHFNNVNDKLYNLLDLAENKERSELLMASIEQRSQELDGIPFLRAIDIKESLGYAKYSLAPLAIIGLLWLSGSISSFFGSYERVVNYDLAYEPPAPFLFQLLNDRLTVLDNEPLQLRVNTTGDIRPDNMYLMVDGEQLLMQESNGVFQYVMEAPVKEGSFYFTANDYNSRQYQMKSLSTPVLQDFTMKLRYPNYTGRSDEQLKGTGNAVIPEGTNVTWLIKGEDITQIDWSDKDTLIAFSANEEGFIFSKRFYDNTDYSVATSNENVTNYERLNYNFSVVRDAHPTIKAEQFVDSLDVNVTYFSGQVADDYSVSQVRVVCYPITDKENEQRLVLQRPNSNVAQFYYTFPSGLVLEEGQGYELYFEVIDNDGLRGGKRVRSQTFTTRIYDDNELKDNKLEYQESVLDKLNKSVERQKVQSEELTRINEQQKQQNKLDFDDKAKIKDFLKKQEAQENLMQKFTKELKESLKDEMSDQEKALLKERLERQEKQAEKNAKLLEELNKIADKIDKEELKKRLEELGKNQSSSQRNLEQIVELTKRYYVTEKASQLAKKLEELAEEQEKLSKQQIGEDFSEEEQNGLNQDFDTLSKELEELTKDNKDLKKPLDLNIDNSKSAGVKQDQQEALEEIQKHQKGGDQPSKSEAQKKSQNNASKKQKSAAQKMKEMSNGLEQSASSGGGSTIVEDAAMLRQILDNLLTFSFKQEYLFDKLRTSDVEISQFSATVREQKELRNLFEHVDDSLFALSLRRAELSEFVNEQITEVYYNIDKSLESIADNQMYQGVSYQQYVLNASNSLADFLADLLDNMQQSMQPGSGSGQGGADFQLPDIIQGQGQLQQKMGQSGQSGQEGKSGQQGKNGQEQGENGQSGENGKEGQQGENGQKGQDGKQGQGKGNQDGDGSGGSGSGEMSESDLQEIYEIYKQQQFLRNQLERQLENMIDNGDRELTNKLVRQMENFEEDLIENGITERTINKINAIQHQLLKLENAALEQGQKQERESESNRKEYTSPITTRPALLQQEGSEIEILNRQALPLRQKYQKKVKRYFKDEN